MRAEPVPLRSLPTPPERLTPLTISGRPDYRYEVALTGRTRSGYPGVNIVTPVRISGTDTAILVNRGWVYAADGATVDLGKWREPDPNGSEGYVRPFADGPRESRRQSQYCRYAHRRRGGSGGRGRPQIAC